MSQTTGFQNDTIVSNAFINNPFIIDITANTDDLDSNNYSLLVITNTTGGSLNITGSVAKDDGYILGIYNSETSTGNVVLKYNTTSAAANQFKNFTGVDITLTPGKFFRFFYYENKWR